MSFMFKVYNFISATFKINITFEVTDNPDDTSEHQRAVKPVNIFYYFLEADSEMISSELQYAKGNNKEKCIRNVTKNTDKSIRKFNYKTLGNVKLFVLAEPADGWKEHYDNCLKTVNLKPGSTQNITISLPIKSNNKGKVPNLK